MAACMLSLSALAVKIPPTMGSTSRSKHSRPKRRTANDSTLSSWLSRLAGTNASLSTRNLPDTLKIGVAKIEPIRVGCMREKPLGIGYKRPRQTT